MAKDAGARIVVVTDKPSALLAEYASVLLTVPVDSNNFFNSMVGPQFVAEALLDTISHKVRGVEKRLKKIGPVPRRGSDLLIKMFLNILTVFSNKIFYSPYLFFYNLPTLSNRRNGFMGYFFNKRTQTFHLFND